DPGGCAGPGPGNGNPTTYPPPCNWNLYASQSLNLGAGVPAAVWTPTQITTTPMHVGDICNLGIACLAPSSNRNLLDFISEAADPGHQLRELRLEIASHGRVGALVDGHPGGRVGDEDVADAVLDA